MGSGDGERYADAIGGEKGWLSMLNHLDGSGGDGGVVARIDPSEMGRYVDYYADRNPLFHVDDTQRYLAAWAPRILTDEDWMPKADLICTEYYNDFLKPQDIHSCVMVRLARRGTETAAINITRSARADRPSTGGRSWSARAAPHRSAPRPGQAAQERHGRRSRRRRLPRLYLIRAFDLGQKLAQNRALSSGFAAVFDGSAHGLFLLDADGRVRQMNRAADGLVAERPSGLSGLRRASPGAGNRRRSGAPFAGPWRLAAPASPRRRRSGADRRASNDTWRACGLPERRTRALCDRRAGAGAQCSPCSWRERTEVVDRLRSA